MNRLTGKIQLNFRNNEPLYMQIARQIEQLVAQGDLMVGDQLPTVRELATELRINFNTVARAYHVLDDARLISTQRGRGTYIWEEPTPEMIQALRKQTIEELALKFLRECLSLGYPISEAIDTINHLVDDGSFSDIEDAMENNHD